MKRSDLQVHLMGAPITWVLKSMEARNIEIIALLFYKWERETLYSLSKIEEETKVTYKMSIQERNLISFRNKKTDKQLWIVLGEEVATSDKEWHILSIGAQNIETMNLGHTIERILAKGGLPIIDHPFADPSKSFADLNEKKEVILRRICEEFKGNIALEWNAYCIPLMRKITNIFLSGYYGDCNQRTKKMAKELNIPLVPTSDLHIKSEGDTKKIGTAYIEADLDVSNLLTSLKKVVLTHNFKAHEEYIKAPHFILRWGLPHLKEYLLGR